MLLKIFARILVRFTVALLIILQLLRTERRKLVIVGESNRSNVLRRRRLEHASGLVLLVATTLLLVHNADKRCATLSLLAWRNAMEEQATLIAAGYVAVVVCWATSVD